MDNEMEATGLGLEFRASPNSIGLWDWDLW